MTPTNEVEALSLRQGARLAVEGANRTLSEKVRLVVRGRAGQWGTESDEVSSLALDEQVSAIIAPPGGAASHQVLQVAGRTRVPVISLCPDSSVTGTGIPWIVRIVPRTDEQALAVFSAWTTNRLGHPLRWAAIVPEGRAGRETSRDLMSAARNARCSLDEPVALSQPPIDWRPLLKMLLANRPDGILVWMEARRGGHLVRSLRDAGFGGLLAGPESLQSRTFLQSTGPAAEGFVIPVIVPTDESRRRTRIFSEAHRRQFGSEPDFTATMAHDAAALLIQLSLATPHGPPFGWFPLQGRFAGASGELEFDGNGNRILRLGLCERRNGRFVPLANVPPSSERSLVTRPLDEPQVGVCSPGFSRLGPPKGGTTNLPRVVHPKVS
ncbi:MAG: amino acid ABC transporter substrate-binding protein, partial [Verrucomicrobia bacterium]|nr:amino acid ABC transporter substrate-binding protein [Verrucomicrobiota bacterium]